MNQYGALDDTFYFHFASNTTLGAGGDGASPLCSVRLCGAAANAAAVYKPTPTLLTHADYVDGAYEISIVASAANGFAAASTYAVFCSLTISAVNPNGFIGLILLKSSPDTSGVTELLTRIPDATAGQNGGLMICGSNAATTFATLSVTGQLDAGNVLVNTTVVVTTNLTVSGTTTLTGNVTLSGTLGVVGATTLASLSVTGQLDAGNVLVDTTTVLTGAVTLSSTLATGAVTLSALTVTNNLAVGGTTTITGNITLSGTLDVGAATLASLTVTAALTAGSIVNNGVFTQTGAVTLTSTLATGAVTLSTLTVTNNLAVGGTTTLTGNVTLSGTLEVGATTLSALTITNNLLISGTITSTGVVTFTAGLVSNITGNITGALSGAVGSITGVTFPTNFGVLSITAVTGLVDITQTAADKAWATAVRTLTAGTNIVLAKGVGVTGFNDIAAADVAALILVTPAQKLVTNVSGYVTVGTDLSIVEGAITSPQALQVSLAILSGKASGGDTASQMYRDQADTKNRVSMTVDADGNRSATSLDLD